MTNGAAPGTPNIVKSLLDTMEDGNEYGSIINCMLGGDFVVEVRRAIADIEAIRKRPLVCYLANVVRPPAGPYSIETSDDLPFNEMIGRVDASADSVDILLVTPGGSGQQIYQFVNALRARFKAVDFLLPYMCMSAGTLWALSGDEIWMDERAFIGPIDPQVPSKDGRFVPAQSVLVLMKKLQEDGQKQVDEGKRIDWSIVRTLDNMDHRQLGDAITSSKYSIKLASEFLEKYKFKSWTTHSSSGQPVSAEERKERANLIAEKLCSHEYWLSHGQGISREMAESGELRLKINKPESSPGLQRAIRRLWALFYWAFDKSPTLKTMVSKNYILVRTAQIQVLGS
jgi:hypothetical protein